MLSFTEVYAPDLLDKMEALAHLRLDAFLVSGIAPEDLVNGAE
jgi:hypothetical protein